MLLTVPGMHETQTGGVYLNQVKYKYDKSRFSCMHINQEKITFAIHAWNCFVVIMPRRLSI